MNLPRSGIFLMENLKQKFPVSGEDELGKVNFEPIILFLFTKTYLFRIR